MKPIRFGKYQLLDRISHGGMAEVFRAKTFGAAGFERMVAIKLLLPTVAMDREFITMLVDEAKIAGQLNHANIAQIFDLGMAEGRYYIVQEYVNGKDMRAILRHMSQKDQLMSIAQSCHLMLKVCEGLDYAHNKRDPTGRALNLVHRDVSPQNIVVSREGEVKLIDFGIAKAEGRATRTLAGLVKGKFAYMSPEQIRGLPVDRRSDVFACGIVLHELLTGKPLFRRKSEFETLKRARSAEIEPPSLFNPAVPPALDRVVLRALARHVEDRPQTAIALRDDLWDFVRSSANHYARNDLSAWMRDNFPKETGPQVDDDYDVQVEPDDNATVVDTPLRREDFSPPTVEYKTPRPDRADDWGTIDDLAQGPNPDSIEYMPDLAALQAGAGDDMALIGDRPPNGPSPRPASGWVVGASAEMVGATPYVPHMRHDIPQPPLDIEEEPTNESKRGSSRGARRTTSPRGVYQSTRPYQSPSRGGNGRPDPSAVTTSMTSTYPYVRAQGSLPPSTLGAPPSFVSVDRKPGGNITDKISRTAAKSSSRWNSVLVAAAVFLLLLAGATSITLAVKNSGKTSASSTER